MWDTLILSYLLNGGDADSKIKGGNVLVPRLFASVAKEDMKDEM